jgi:hypothetical protein
MPDDVDLDLRQFLLYQMSFAHFIEGATAFLAD